MGGFNGSINSQGVADELERLQAVLRQIEDMSWYVELDEEWPPYHLSKKGRDFIIRHETIGGKPNLKGYRDVAKHPTIGYGHEIKRGEDFSNGVTMTEALALLDEDIQSAVDEVNAALNVPLTQNQFDALVDLAYNEGPGSVESGHEMMDAVNAYDVTEFNFTQYDLITVRGRKVSSPGLLKRRIEEWLLFEEGKY